MDYGCGPGHFACELARRVGPDGRVWGLDINSEFLERTRERARSEGFDERLRTAQVEKDQLPLADATVDRVVCKNVLEYVPDPDQTIREFRRVLRPGGLAHVTDSDWGLITLEPHGIERVSELMEWAKVAFQTPLIGRSLYGRFRAAGFTDVRVQILANGDTQGFMRPVLQNMVTYARASGRADEAVLERFLSDVDAALEAQTYLAILPQFLVTGRA